MLVLMLSLSRLQLMCWIMPTLMILGGLSDRIGRRLPIAFALLLGLIATALLVMFPNWFVLVLARFLLGVSTGLATTSGTAYMTEIIGEKKAKQAALLVTSATSLGFGGGALATGISISLQGTMLVPASYLVLFTLTPILIFIVMALPRVDIPKSVSMLRLPVFPVSTWPFGVALALAWSTTGMTIALIPLQLEQQGFGAYTGLVIFLAIFVGFLCQPLARRMGNQKSLMVGFVLVPLGFLILLVGVWMQSIWFILAGTAITSSASYGFTYLASLAEFSIRAPDNRAPRHRWIVCICIYWIFNSDHSKWSTRRLIWINVSDDCVFGVPINYHHYGCWHHLCISTKTHMS